jgi:hypothetical protein
MAGRKQHYIPQAVQRSFEAARTGTKAQVLVFRKDRKAYLTATDGSAAERDFYSNPLTDGIGALDDKITDFEAAHLGPILQQLRSTPYGEVDSGLAAIAIAHLAFRTAHLRGSMAAIADDGLAQMQAVVEDSQALRRFAGIDSLPANSPMTELIQETLSEAGADNWPEKERTAAERIIAFRVRERFDDLVPQAISAFSDRLGWLQGSLTDLIPLAHARALSQSLVPDSRVQPLRELKWFVVAADTQDGHFILPDCVVVGTSTSSCELQPYSMLAPDEVCMVVMPLSSRQLLVGNAQDVQIAQAQINLQLARCSLDFFVSSKEDAETCQAAEVIGTYAAQLKLERLDDDDSRADDKSLSISPPARALKIRTPVGKFGDAAKKALASIAKTSIELESADTIESISVPSNLRCELQTLLKRVPSDAELQYVAFGAVQPVKLNDLWKCRIILPRNVVELLLQTEDSMRNLIATRVIKYNFGRAYHFACWAQRNQHMFDVPRAEEWTQIVENVVFRTGSDYFGGLASARHEATCLPTDDMLQATAAFIDQGITSLNASRQHFFLNRDLTQLVRDAVSSVEVILVSVASAIGILEANNTTIAPTSDVGISLTSAGLLEWSQLFAKDLRRYYERRYRWSPDAELTDLSRHVERLLWTIGVFVSETDEGPYLDVIGDEQLVQLKRLLHP